ncbi:MAG: hypothetical protein R3A52_16465 [Polyangiales bacterium]
MFRWLVEVVLPYALWVGGALGSSSASSSRWAWWPTTPAAVRSPA